MRQRSLDAAIFKRVGARHYVDRVDEELCCDASLFFVLAKAKKSHARDDDHGRICVAQFGRIRSRPFLVVVLVHRPVRNDLRNDVRLKRIHILFGRFPMKKKRADARAQEVVGAARAKFAQFSGPLRARENQCIFVVRKVRDDTPV